MPEQIELTYNKAYPEQTVAQLLSIIAYPDDPAAARRFVRACGAYFLQRKARNNLRWARRPQTITPALLMADLKKEATIIKRGLKWIVAHRFTAVDMANLLLLDVSSPTSRGNGSGATRKPIGITKMAAKFAQHMNALEPFWEAGTGGAWDDQKLFDRIWNPSKPVLHLAIALKFDLEEHDYINSKLDEPLSLSLDEPLTLSIESILAMDRVRLSRLLTEAEGQAEALDQSDKIHGKGGYRPIRVSLSG